VEALTESGKLSFKLRCGHVNGQILPILGEILEMYEDKALICKDCGAEFIFTIGEQEFFAEKGFVNEPQRCKECRDLRKRNGAKREMYVAACASCGAEAKVPFKPSEGRPVYCSECFAKREEEN
jgi:CxxC-x17-CxxC domain-containing protein